MKNRVWLFLIVLIMIVIPVTYAWWTWTNAKKTNLTINVDGIDITYVGGPNITGINLIPVESKETGLRNGTAILKEVTTSSTSTLYMNLYLILETLPDEFKDKSLVYEVYNGSNLVGKGNFKSYEQGDKLLLANSQTITSQTSSFKVYIWIDANNDNPTNMMNQNFKFVLSAEATDNLPSDQTLIKLGVDPTKILDESTIDFKKLPYMTMQQAEEVLQLTCPLFYDTSDITTCLSENFDISTIDAWVNKFVSSENDNGIVETVDDLGTSYYYRGNVENNYVYFAGFYWRIIRINGDGTIRMIYDGTTKQHNGMTMSDNSKSALVSNYNEELMDNASVGYMYGTPNSTYENTHKNTNNSLVKTNIDKWYEDTIIASNNEKYVADAIYCNDRSLYTGTLWGENFVGDGTGTTLTAYNVFKRMELAAPSLICNQDNDKFSVTSIGNEKLVYPVAMLTMDEGMLGGLGFPNLEEYALFMNPHTYLSDIVPYWTMSPLYFSPDGAYIGDVHGGMNYAEYNYSELGVRPVISLKSDITFTGNGTYDTPFVVGP